MQVKCDYCGAYLDDTQKFCTNCGAANANLKRVVSTTPKTIDELIDWYKARNLPPFETTRFFIGIDYKEPKAFGIYKDGSDFVVYKNKTDGSRAVRYRGQDEAYAVNELYLRLKEEILNQKNVNSARRNGAAMRKKKEQSAMKGCLIAVIVAVLGAIGLGGMVTHNENKKPKSDRYYMAEDGTLYYYDGYNSYSGISESGYEWWVYRDGSPDWNISYSEPNKHGFIDGLTKENICGEYGFFYEVADELGISGGDYANSDTSIYNVTNSRLYTDYHHISPSSDAYYYVNGQAYYYLNDMHGYSYGNGDHSGWYIYDDSDGWEYYCSGSDHDTLGDELWYDDDKYRIGSSYSDYETYVSGSVYNFSDIEAGDWSESAMARDFAETEWYQDKVLADEAYDDYWATHQSSSSSSSSSDWSSDSDWDWDSGSDSWDSGSTDWDSDW